MRGGPNNVTAGNRQAAAPDPG